MIDTVQQKKNLLRAKSCVQIYADRAQWLLFHCYVHLLYLRKRVVLMAL